MQGYQASSVIDATPEAIWAVLTDGASWTSWDSAVVRFEGSIALGEKVTVYPEVNPKRGFPVTVVEFVPAERMTWRGGMPLGLFAGTRRYILTRQPDGRVLFEMREQYSGPLAGMISRSVPDLAPSFARFAQGLKDRVESSAR
jgi:hypothetical protein